MTCFICLQYTGDVIIYDAMQYRIQKGAIVPTLQYQNAVLSVYRLDMTQLTKYWFDSYRYAIPKQLMLIRYQIETMRNR